MRIKTNRLASPLVLACLGVTVFPALALAQAAAEYGMAASKSTVLTSQVRSIVGSRGRQSTLQIPTPASKNLLSVMQENRHKLEEKSRSGGGVVHVESVPARAVIAVDGDLVDFAPTDLKLPEGKHLIELALPDYQPWRIKVTVNRQESTAVTAQLESRYKGSVTLSFDK